LSSSPSVFTHLAFFSTAHRYKQLQKGTTDGGWVYHHFRATKVGSSSSAAASKAAPVLAEE